VTHYESPTHQWWKFLKSDRRFIGKIVISGSSDFVCQKFRKKDKEDNFFGALWQRKAPTTTALGTAGAVCCLCEALYDESLIIHCMRQRCSADEPWTWDLYPYWRVAAGPSTMSNQPKNQSARCSCTAPAINPF